MDDQINTPINYRNKTGLKIQIRDVSTVGVEVQSLSEHSTAFQYLHLYLARSLPAGFLTFCQAWILWNALDLADEQQKGHTQTAYCSFLTLLWGSLLFETVSWMLPSKSPHHSGFPRTPNSE